jgi:hypothetical protein
MLGGRALEVTQDGSTHASFGGPDRPSSQASAHLVNVRVGWVHVAIQDVHDVADDGVIVPTEDVACNRLALAFRHDRKRHGGWHGFGFLRLYFAVFSSDDSDFRGCTFGATLPKLRFGVLPPRASRVGLRTTGEKRE